jgi:type IV pilus assembly protein PilV
MKASPISRGPRQRCWPRQQGATLIEILVTVLILSLGMLGMAAMQTRAVKGSFSAGQRSQSVMLAQYMLDVMRVDREHAKGGDYNTGSTAVCNAAAFGAGSLANNARTAWLNEVKAAIGRTGDTTTCAQINCDAEYVCTVRIQWDDSRAGGLSNQTAVLTSRV